jgi:hypothetical protein
MTQSNTNLETITQLNLQTLEILRMDLHQTALEKIKNHGEYTTRNERQRLLNVILPKKSALSHNNTKISNDSLVIDAKYTLVAQFYPNRSRGF